MNNNIIIEDWAGNVLFTGDYSDKLVDSVLEANRCYCVGRCSECDGSGYKGDFSIRWQDDKRTDNVYEFIENY